MTQSQGSAHLGYSNMLEYVPIVTSIAAFMTWFKCLYFMRAFSGTGGLVRLMIEITYDMRCGIPFLHKVKHICWS